MRTLGVRSFHEVFDVYWASSACFLSLAGAAVVSVAESLCALLYLRQVKLIFLAEIALAESGEVIKSDFTSLFTLNFG